MNGRILCTEDDADTQEMLTVLLESFGYEVVCPADSSLALELMRGLHFDLCLLDNWMPGLSGLELTQKIREFNKTVPILFYSGAVQETDRQQALDAGAQGYLFKPVDSDELIQAINGLINKSRRASSELDTLSYKGSVADSVATTRADSRLQANQKQLESQ